MIPLAYDSASECRACLAASRAAVWVKRPKRRMRSPSYFGEIGVLERIPRTATVTAVTACRCEQIDGDDLLDALTTAPPSATLMENAQLLGIRSRVPRLEESRRNPYEGIWYRLASLPE